MALDDIIWESVQQILNEIIEYARSGASRHVKIPEHKYLEWFAKMNKENLIKQLEERAYKLLIEIEEYLKLFEEEDSE